jgi:adenosylmethionine-8-amino-7-oxononanoate aminotransferase
VYAMPPFICTPAEIEQVTSTMVEVARLSGSRRI